MNNIFIDFTKCGSFQKPSHVVHGKMQGDYKLDQFQHQQFLNEQIKAKTTKGKKDYSTVTYSPIRNQWDYYSP